MYITYNKLSKKILRADTDDMMLIDNDIETVETDISEEVLNNLHLYNYDNGKFIKSEESEAEYKLYILREQRKPLLTAFDLYKSNVAYGVIEETDNDKQNIVAWYKAILDLNEEAITNPPEQIKYFIQ